MRSSRYQSHTPSGFEKTIAVEQNVCLPHIVNPQPFELSFGRIPCSYPIAAEERCRVEVRSRGRAGIPIINPPPAGQIIDSGPGGSCTLARFFDKGNRAIRLQKDNPKFEPIRCDRRDSRSRWQLSGG